MLNLAWIKKIWGWVSKKRGGETMAMHGGRKKGTKGAPKKGGK